MISQILNTTEESQATARVLENATLIVADVTTKIEREVPAPPYTTAELLQSASSELGWTSAKTMGVAQLLFERGHITYPRTDSIYVADEARQQAREVVKELYGRDFLSQSKTRNQQMETQEGAHEAIRPTSATNTPETMAGKVETDARALYQLIWQRFIANEMKEATWRVTAVEFEYDS